MPTEGILFSHGRIEEFMKLKYDLKYGEEGKGAIGCIVALFLMIAAIFLAIKLGPPYFYHYEFKGDLKQAVSRAGAHLIADENIKKDVKAIAQKNNIILKDEEITIDKTVPARVIIEIKYAVPVDFIILKRDINFHAREEGLSFI